jgi:hypothetical protein
LSAQVRYVSLRKHRSLYITFVQQQQHAKRQTSRSSQRRRISPPSHRRKPLLVNAVVILLSSLCTFIWVSVHNVVVIVVVIVVRLCLNGSFSMGQRRRRTTPPPRADRRKRLPVCRSFYFNCRFEFVYVFDLLWFSLLAVTALSAKTATFDTSNDIRIYIIDCATCTVNETSFVVIVVVVEQRRQERQRQGQRQAQVWRQEREKIVEQHVKEMKRINEPQRPSFHCVGRPKRTTDD